MHRDLIYPLPHSLPYQPSFIRLTLPTHHPIPLLLLLTLPHPQDNAVYGRSPLEAASFLVSSAFPDPKLHGASFMPRLSGSTAEFLSMWSIMMAGIKPFSLDSDTNELQLRLAPSLPGTFFNEDGTASFTFLGGVEVVYHNPTRVDSWTLSPRSAVVMYRDGRIEQSIDGVIRGEVAKDIRDLKAATINIYL